MSSISYYFSTLLGALAALSIILNLWQFLVARKFPLHRRSSILNTLPPVALLKPLKGRDAMTEACLRTWFEQDYPNTVQILFGVADIDDPVSGLVSELMKEYPGRAKLVHCTPLLGSNAKVSSLIHLGQQTEYEHTVVSDADVAAPPDFLAQIISQLLRNKAGVVNAFYYLAEPKNLAMKWEAVAVNADFWSQVLQGISLKKMDFALGAVMATTRSHLQAIGGFESLVEYLADDYQLGNKVAATGAKVELSSLVVKCLSEENSWPSVWAHQLRWARTVRVCQPAPYFFSILSNATLWPLLLFAIFPCAISATILAVAATFRIVTAAINYSALAHSTEGWKLAWIAPFKDCLHVIIWMLSFTGNKIEWRGQKFRVERGGKLVPLGANGRA
ncbi:MAG: glycosyltransferase [Verrucomicrobiales bacterium]